MRAAATLGALSGRHRVSLLVVPLYAAPDAELRPELARLCERVEIVEPGRLADAPPAPRPGWRTLLARLGGSAGPPRPFRGARFDVVHVFRLAAVPFAARWLEGPERCPVRQLDLDDVESVSRRRLGELYRRNARPAEAAYELEQADRAAEQERWALRELERVYVCSEPDRQRLEAGARARLCVLPNTLPVPAPLAPASDEGPFTFLFLGTLGYFPNEDAAITFAERILPLIKGRTGRPVRLLVAGLGAGAELARRLAAADDVRLLGAVPDVREAYSQAHGLVVPLRAAGGTRIKILEAFGYRRPVVTTSLGIEGLAAIDGEHVLVADDPADFAAACRRLIDSPRLAADLAERAYALFLSAYSTEAAARAIAACEAG